LADQVRVRDDRPTADSAADLATDSVTDSANPREADRVTAASRGMVCAKA